MLAEGVGEEELFCSVNCKGELEGEGRGDFTGGVKFFKLQSALHLCMWLGVVVCACLHVCVINYMICCVNPLDTYHTNSFQK